MGGKCPHRKVKKRRLSHKSARRTKFELKDILFPIYPRANEVGRGVEHEAHAGGRGSSWDGSILLPPLRPVLCERGGEGRAFPVEAPQEEGKAVVGACTAYSTRC
ncbi:zinc finger C2H2 protein [Iris pallida]|uniref:Zinc finger C2H2 protein n=1 Tax=Iris pallida TaxID=29817 RepID=A0AAX6EHA4_IRIPA|nr:zinc finger C2H2 protein [Iris pallida]